MLNKKEYSEFMYQILMRNWWSRNRAWYWVPAVEYFEEHKLVW